ncbi:MAG TPA: hypothetical protein PKD09_17850 [Aggregatilinea sp.]|uniref:hypothetical protein n=1 Tax=Aggregatilinea sp. TaxID=2806333 RepID=UPI002CF5D579|nr:hypothetical protein [Aggregatilinea sp.]HML23525.1 hypothetical protein [Aggregatilinea sp.]
MDSIDRLARAILDTRKSSTEEDSTLLGYLGFSPDGTTYALEDSEPNYLWLRLGHKSSRAGVKALNRKPVPIVPDLAVRVRPPRGDHGFEITDVDAAEGFSQLGSSGVAPVGGQQYRTSLVHPRQLEQGRVKTVYDGAAKAWTTQVEMAPFTIVWNGVRTTAGRIQKDLASYRPASGFGWIAVGYDPAASDLVAVAGPDVVSKNFLSDAALDGVLLPASVIPLAGIKAQAGAVFDNEYDFVDISPWRSGVISDWSWLKHNLTATSDPGAGDDADDGYGVGSVWINTTAGTVWTCTDATAGSAVWTEGGGGGGSIAVTDGTTTVDPATALDLDPAFFDVSEPSAGQASVTLTLPLDNLSATSAPTAGDDSGDGYSVGSRWVDTAVDKAYVCLDATLGGAVWKEITATAVTTNAATAVDQALWAFEGALDVVSSPLRILNESGAARTITKVALSIDTAPTGAAVIVDVHKNGTTIFTTQANRPQIADGAYAGESTTIDVATWSDGEYLTVDIDQIGSSVAGANMTVHVIYSIDVAMPALDDLTDVDASAPDDGDVLTYDDGTGTWVPAPSSGGASAFTDLTDTPGDYTDQGGKLVAVNAGETGLEFVDAGGSGSTTNVLRVALAGSTTTEGVARTGSTASSYVRANAQVRVLRPIKLTELIIDLAAAGDYYVKWYYGQDGSAIDSALTGALMFTLGPVTVGGSTNDQSMPLASPLFVPPGDYVFSLERASGTSIMPAATSGTFAFSFHDNDGIPTSATRIPFRMVAYAGDYELVTA